MSIPLVSVIIPVYNCEKYIKKALKSIANQSFDDYEILVYDDGSTDNSFGIASYALTRYFEPKSIHYLHFLDSKNKGVFQARTNVIRTSQSKYIALQDADDISLPNRLQKQIDFLEQNEDVWCVGSHSIKIDEEGNEIGEMTYPPSSDIDVIKMITNKCMNPILDPSVVFRREVFLEIGGYSLRKDRKLVDDFDMWCKSILKNKKFYNIQDKLIKYRINLNGNTLKFKKDMIKQHMMVWREFMREYKGKQE